MHPIDILTDQFVTQCNHPYHTILGRRGRDLPQTTLRPIKMANAHALPEWEGRKDRECIHYPGVGGALLLPLFCWQCVCVCSVCKGD